MKRRIIRAAEASATGSTESYDILQDAEDKLAHLSDQFWTLTPTETQRRINSIIRYIKLSRKRANTMSVSNDIEESCNVKADTVKKNNGKWVNRGDTGKEHGEFDTKKEADAQRRAMYATGYKG